MNNEEIQSLMSQLKNAGLSEEDIANGILWPLFRDGKMSKEDLNALMQSIGLELDEEFAEDEGPDTDEGDTAAEGVTAAEAEEAKEIKPGESKEEFEEKVEDFKKDDDEEAEWEEAKKLFKL